jgi:hypothetical protein
MRQLHVPELHGWDDVAVAVAHLRLLVDAAVELDVLPRAEDTHRRVRVPRRVELEMVLIQREALENLRLQVDPERRASGEDFIGIDPQEPLARRLG